MSDALDRLNGLSEDEASAVLSGCCASRTWVAGMVAGRPFASIEAALDAADAVWAGTAPDDWREAFDGHPRIGERNLDRQSAAEQSGVAGAGEDVHVALAEANAEYERRFGFIFLICATGKTADEMLQRLRERLGHDVETELAEAAEQQRQITRRRLEKLLQS